MPFLKRKVSSDENSLFLYFCSPGVLSVATDVQNQIVLVQSSLPTTAISDIIEKTGKQAVYRGAGSGGYCIYIVYKYIVLNIETTLLCYRCFY